MHKNQGQIMKALGAVVVVLLIALALWPRGQQGKILRLLVAEAVAHSFMRIKTEFERDHPDTTIELEFQGSAVLLRLLPMRKCDVAVVADPRLVERMLNPHTATWVAKFGTTEMVLAYTGASKYASQMNADNWYEILLQKEVHYSYSDPSQDPCGYFTLLCWKLAEKHYATRTNDRSLYDELKSGCDPNHVRSDALQLLTVLESQTAYDYTFVYRCLAVSHHLPCLRLPREINLGDINSESQYAKVQLEVPSPRGNFETVSGSCISFGITIPEDCRNRKTAEEFVTFVLSKNAGAILADSAIIPLDPPVVPSWGRIPSFLEGVAISENRTVSASQAASIHQ